MVLHHYQGSAWQERMQDAVERKKGASE